MTFFIVLLLLFSTEIKSRHHIRLVSLFSHKKIEMSPAKNSAAALRVKFNSYPDKSSQTFGHGQQWP